MKRLALLLAFLLVLPMGAAEGGETMAQIVHNGRVLPETPAFTNKPYQFVIHYEKNDRYGAFGCENPLTYNADNVGYFTGPYERYQMSAPYTNWGSGNTYPGNSTLSMSDRALIWSNHDIISTVDGSVVFPNSESTSTGSKLTISFGHSGEGYRFYNGERLPDIEAVWVDKTAQPYAYITRDISVYYLFLVSKEPTYHYKSNMGFIESGYIVPQGSLVYKKQGDAWSLYSTVTSDSLYFIRYDAGADYTKFIPFWATFDMSFLNGSVKASTGGAIGYAAFYCDDLDSTDSVYKIAAWCYPKGANYQDAPFTYVSGEYFAGTTHAEIWELIGPVEGVVYELYACILANDVATDHSALMTFTVGGTTEDLDFTNTSLYVENPEYTETTADFDIGWTNLPQRAYPNVAHYFISAELNDGTEQTVYLFSSADPVDDAHWFSFTDLKPGTEYTLTARLLYNKTGEYSDFTDSGVCVTCDFNTLGSNRDSFPLGFANSFPLGFASGLCGMPITEADAEYNSWAQGYLVGCALRKALVPAGSGPVVPDTPDTEIWAEVVDGVLYIHRAYSAAQSGDTLEVT